MKDQHRAEDQLVEGPAPHQTLWRAGPRDRRAAEALCQSETRFRVLADSLRDCACVPLDADGRVAGWDAAAERLLGYAPQEVEGRSFACFFPHEDVWLGKPDQALETAAEGRFEGAGVLMRRDGSRFPADIVLAALRGADGRPDGYLMVLRDTTSQRNLEAELRALDEAFRQAQKQAAVGWLAAGLAHNFNNLLTAVLGYCDLLLQEPLAAPVREGLERIQKTAVRGTSLPRQLMALCSTQPPQSGVLDLGPVLGDVADMFRRLLEANVVLDTAFDRDLGRIRADAGQVEQVLLNLVRNACDAMPEGGRLTIEAANVHVESASARGDVPPGAYVLLAVTDTGSGMTVDVLADPFRPLRTTKGPGKGNGLGLFMVQQIVREWGGFLTVSSRPGHGTRFEVYLPRIAAAADGGA